MDKNELLDFVEQKQEEKNYKQYSSLVITVLIVIFSLCYILLQLEVYNADGSISHAVIPESIILGLLGLLFSITFVFVRNKIWNMVFLLFLLLCHFEILSVSTHTYTFGIFVLKVNVIPFFLILIHLFCNKSIIDRFRSKKILDPEKVKEEQIRKEKNFEAAVQIYIEKWGGKSKEELERIIENNLHVKEAIEVAKRLRMQD